jgi:hypothetical protein
MVLGGVFGGSNWTMGKVMLARIYISCQLIYGESWSNEIPSTGMEGNGGGRRL